ncbi:MAG TPA: M20 family metallopeptidase [Gemmatimonadaceae bacterium]|nr:M20 family metallopeptidase [Gemmatimonadaceae bacterium]
MSPSDSARHGILGDADVRHLVELRRDLHRHPELSWKETRTAARLEQELAALGVTDLCRVAGTGIVARIRGERRDAPVVAIRGDIDALPIAEATGLPYASEAPGVMHACGHDVHATWTVGAAMLLSRVPARGDVLIVLQPAEEVGQGARAMLESGALDTVRAIFGGHVDRRFAVGQVVAQPGPLAASTDTFDIELLGSGAHGARPHESADPVIGLAALVTALQTIVSRRLDPALPGVVTVGTVQAGTAPNIIPDRARLSGTIRATTPESRTLLTSELHRMAESVAATHGLAANITLRDGTPPVLNDADAAAWAQTAVTAVLGPAALVPLGTVNMGGEDFAYYQERVPGCFMRIGAREPGGERTPAHSTRFHAAEGAIAIGAMVLAESARVASAALTGRGATSPG